MSGLIDKAAGFRGMLFHGMGAVLVFAVWRLTGMPSPGTLGRLIPLAWFITAIVSGRESVSAASAWLLGAFLILATFWASSPPMFIISSSCGLAALFPGLLRVSRTRLGLLTAMIPLVPLVLLLVPFTGDEPHYAWITESIFPGDGDAFSGYAYQRGDTVEGISHHQSLFPALMLPGYPLGMEGLRLVNILFALAATIFMSMILRSSGSPRWRELSLLGILMVPGSAVLGLVYPGWLALAVFLLGIHMFLSGGRRVWVVAAAAVLVLLKMRFAGISAGMLTALVLETRGRRRWTLPIVLAGLAVAGLLFDLVFLGGRVFWVRYGNAPFLKTVLLQPFYRYPDMIVSAFSTLVDVESGLLWKAPWVLAALAGLPVLRRENRRLFRWLGIPALVYTVFLVLWAGVNWSGMPTPAGRMLLPLLPLLLASLGKVWDRRGTAVLVWVSLAVSAAQFCHPLLRFNYADGTDNLMSMLAGPLSGIYAWLPTAVRFRLPAFAIWTLLSALVIWFVHRRSRVTEYAIAAGFGFLCLLGGMPRTDWEAEDIPSSMMDFCTLYPAENEPESRAYWLFSRERMLLLSGRGDRVRIPLNAAGGEAVTVTVSFRGAGSGEGPGLRASCGGWSDSIFAVSEVMEPPVWTTLIRDTRLEGKPENLRELTWRITVPAVCDTLILTPIPEAGRRSGCGGIYLDEVSIR
ncbi:MAG: hypothetical protein JXA64_00835 [Candidatus Fermentibacteraceae bacterium]|nr:hypothetical protein [Candidatus Fermentibacteraceae bacterium]MBN2607631.1 hypothetical protein [Candidatus Fermentibacteraceae bacterium]